MTAPDSNLHPKEGDDMRLQEFILTNRDPILVEWEAFARTCLPATETMGVEGLRDHANEMLSMIAGDIQSSQTDREQFEKSRGNARPDAESGRTAAEKHGTERAEAGFTWEQTLAEFRALRSSVLRLWTQEVGRLESSDLDDLIRFNEAIDQLLAESSAQYSETVGNTKEMFLAMLGHDLRTPLGGIQTASKFIVDAGALGEPYHGLTSRISGLAAHALQLVGDLLDFTRSRLGGGIPISRDTVDGRSVNGTRHVSDKLLATW